MPAGVQGSSGAISIEHDDTQWVVRAEPSALRLDAEQQSLGIYRENQKLIVELDAGLFALVATLKPIGAHGKLGFLLDTPHIAGRASFEDCLAIAERLLFQVGLRISSPAPWCVELDLNDRLAEPMEGRWFSPELSFGPPATLTLDPGDPSPRPDASPVVSIEASQEAARELRRAGSRRAAGLAARFAALEPNLDPQVRARLLEEALPLRSDDRHLLAALVAALSEVGRLEAAVRASRRLARLAPTAAARAGAHLDAGQLLLKLNDPLAAGREIERAAKEAPDAPEVAQARARLAEAQGQKEAARDLREEARTRAEAETDPQRRHQLFVSLADLETDVERSGVFFLRAFEADDSDLGPLVELARRAAAADRWRSVREAAERARPKLEDIQDDRERKLAHELRHLTAQAWQGTDDQRAIEELEAALRLDSEDIEARRLLAVLLPEGARRAEVSFELAEDAFENQDLEVAADRIEALRESDSFRHIENSRLNALIIACSEQLPHDLRIANARLDLAESDPATRTEELERRLALDDDGPERWPLLIELGGLLEDQTRRADAIRAFEEAERLRPGNTEAGLALSRLYRARGDQERLSDVLGRLIEQTPAGAKRAGFLAERAHLLVARSEREAAYAAAREAQLNLPYDSSLTRLITDLAMEAGDHPVARQSISARLAQTDATSDDRLKAYLDLADLEEATENTTAVVSALESALALSSDDSASERVGHRLLHAYGELERHGDRASLLRSMAKRTDAAEARAQQYIEAAQARLLDTSSAGRFAEAQWDLDAALGSLPEGQSGRRLAQAALDVLDKVADGSDQAGLKVIALQQRLQWLENSAERVALLLRLAEARASAGQDEEALQCAIDAEDLAPGIEGADRVARWAQRFDRLDVAHQAHARAGRAALAAGEKKTALSRYGRAADLAALVADEDASAEWDAQVIELAGPAAAPKGWLASALNRQLGRAKNAHDTDAWMHCIARLAPAASADQTAAAYLDLAQARLAAGHPDETALTALRRVLAAEPDDDEIRGQAELHLVEILEGAGLYGEVVGVLRQQLQDARTEEERAERALRLARVQGDKLHDKKGAMASLELALEADPKSAAARDLKLELLRHQSEPRVLAAALSKEASRHEDPVQAADLWFEAAQCLDRPNADKNDLERALQWLKEADAAAPGRTDVVEQWAHVAGRMDKSDEVQVALDRLVRRCKDPGTKAWARVRLARASLAADDNLRAAEESLHFISAFAKLDDEDVEMITEKAGRAPAALELDMLSLAADATEGSNLWAEHVQVLSKTVERTADEQERAQLMLRSGEIHEWKLGDGQAAEREYRAAVATAAGWAPATRALKDFYVAADRFADLAEALGTEELEAVYRDFGDEPVRRRIALAEALWPLRTEPEERSSMQLALADLYIQEGGREEDALHILASLEEGGSEESQRAALERLRVFFLENERLDLYCDVLRRQAERERRPEQRAIALADLGEALEWKMGDGVGAEREYRAALASDSQCGAARDRLTTLLASQDRFRDIGADLGMEPLSEVLTTLLQRVGKERERTIAAAAALAEHTPAEGRGELWLQVADRLIAEGPSQSARAREVLEMAVDAKGPTEGEALFQLADLLESTGDHGDLVQTLERAQAFRHDSDPDLLRRLMQARLRRAAELDEAEGGPLREAVHVQLADAIAEHPDHEGLQSLLVEFLVPRSAYREIGERLGLSRLRTMLAEAKDGAERRRIKEAIASLLQGHERAVALIELVPELQVPDDGRGELGVPRHEEGLLQGALEADPELPVARARLEELLVSQGRFRDLAETLGIDVLRTQAVAGRGGLPAMLALASMLEADAGASQERADLLVRAADLHAADGDNEAEERALEAALAADPNNTQARDQYTKLLSASSRWAELGRFDTEALSSAASRAIDSAEPERELEILQELAQHLKGKERADVLLRMGIGFVRSQSLDQAREALIEALEHDPSHRSSRAELLDLLFGEAREVEALERLGATSVLGYLETLGLQQPARTLAIVDKLQDHLPAATQAAVWELAAHLIEPDADPDVDLHRRRQAAEKSRRLWTEHGRSTDQRLARETQLALAREVGTPEELLYVLAEARLDLSADAERAAIDLERGRLLLELGRLDEARAALHEVLNTEGAEADDRWRAAQLVRHDPEAGSALKASALQALTDLHEGRGVAQEELTAWWVQLAEIREVEGNSISQVASALEEVVVHLDTEDRRFPFRRKLLALYEELGDWAKAEQHATLLAEGEERADLWLNVSELRSWIDKRDDARHALNRALQLNPAADEVHGSFLRLAELDGDPQEIAAVLERWASVSGPSGAQTERLLRAAEVMAQSGDVARAAELAERAIAAIPTGDVDLDAQARSASELLAPLGAEDARIAILTQAVTRGSGSIDARVELAELLLAKGRDHEFRSVLEGGLGPNAGGELLRLLVDDAESRGGERAAARLVELAERLGSGPAARELRVRAAEIAEASGATQIAERAWSSIIEGVGAGEAGTRARQALLKIAREERDASSLLPRLIEAVDDAADVKEQVALLLEAAQVADQDLDDASQAEAMFDRARALAPGDPDVVHAYVEFLERRERWIDLESMLAQESQDLDGAALADLCMRRADIARARLRDDAGAAKLYVQAYEAAPSEATGDLAVGALARSGELVAAIRMAERVLAETKLGHPLRLPLQLARAELLELSGEAEAAVTALQEILRDDRTVGLARSRLRFLLDREHREGELAEHFVDSAAIAELSDAVALELAAARLFAVAKNESAAAEALGRALSRVEDEASNGLPLSMSAVVTPRPRATCLLHDLAELASEFSLPNIQVRAARLWVSSLPDGAGRWRAASYLASAEEAAGQVEAAQSTWQDVVAMWDEDPEVSAEDRGQEELSRARLLERLGQFGEALDAIEAAWTRLRNTGERFEGVVLRERALMHQRLNTEEAQSTALDAWLFDPRLLHDASLPLPPLASARAWEREARSQVGEEASDSWLAASQAYKKSGDADRALQAAFHSFKADARRLDDPQALSDWLGAEGRHREQRAVAHAALASAGSSSTASSGWADAFARLLAEAGQFGDAAQWAERGEIDSLVEAHWWAMAGEGDKALAAFDKNAQAEDRRLAKAGLLIAIGRLGDAAAQLEGILFSGDLKLTSALVGGATTIFERAGRLDAVHRTLGEWATHATEYERPLVWGRLAFARYKDDDRRGALLALELALQEAPRDLDLLWAAARRAQEIGNWERAAELAESLAEAAVEVSLPEARQAALHFAARAWSSAGKHEAAFTAYEAVFESAEPSTALATELVLQTRSGLDPEAVLELLSGHDDDVSVEASIRLLRNPLDREDEASALEERLGIEVSEFPRGADDRARSRGVRELELMGRDAERAVELVRWAEETVDPIAQAERELEASLLWHNEATPESRARAQSSLRRVVKAQPQDGAAWALLLNLFMEQATWAEAIEPVARLEALGGPGWPPGRFEAFAARVFGEVGQVDACFERFERAMTRQASTEEILVAAHGPMPGQRGEQLVEAVWRRLHPQLQRDERRELAVARAERALAQADSESARYWAERAREEHPEHADVQALWREALADDAGADLNQELALQMLAAEDKLAESMALRVLDTGTDQDDATKAAFYEVVARGPERKETWRRLVAPATALDDSETVAAAGEALEDEGPLPPTSFASLAQRAYAEGRAEDCLAALEHLMGEPDALHQALLSAVVPGVQTQAWPRAAVLEMIDRSSPRRRNPAVVRGLAELRPQDRSIVEAAAQVDLHSGRGADAARRFRCLLADDPSDLGALRGCLASIDPAERHGPRSVLRYLENGEGSVRLASPRVLLSEEHRELLWGDDPGMLGRVFHMSARWLEQPSVMPEESWRSASDDHRIESLLGRIEAAATIPFRIYVDPQGALDVRLLAGDPTAIVVGEALVDGSSPEELRFWLGQAVRRLETGLAAFDQPNPEARRELLSAMVEQARAGTGRFPSDVRASLCACADQLLQSSEGELARWYQAARASIDRFGFLISGDLNASISALVLQDPRIRAPRSQDERIALASSWEPVRRLIEFVLSDDYSRLTGSASSAATERF